MNKTISIAEEAYPAAHAADAPTMTEQFRASDLSAEVETELHNTSPKENRISIYDFMPIPENELQYNEKFIRKNGVIVLGHLNGENNRTVLVGISEGAESLKEYISIYHRIFDNLPVSYVHIRFEELQLFMNKQYLKHADFTSFLSEKSEGNIFLRQQHNPISNLLNTILLESIHYGAQDIHFEFREQEGIIRIIVANKSLVLRRLHQSLFFPLINQLKILAEMNLLEKRLPQDSAFRYRIGTRCVDIRSSSIGTLHGESLSLRILLPLTSSRRLEELGYQQATIDSLRKILHSEHGLLLFCGPTGSGKSTSMNSLLREFDPDSKKIISIEDPIEIQNPQVEQIQVQEERGLNFAEILKRVLRRNPDVILLGEIRDSETARLAIAAALSGHLIISTIHCSTHTEAYMRLESLGAEKRMIASVIRGIVSQRLITGTEGNLKVKEEVFIPQRGSEKGSAKESKE